MCRSSPYLCLESAENILPLSKSKGTRKIILYLAFQVEEAQIYYELKGFQNIPLGCGGHQGYLTNVQDIYNEELSNAVKLQSLALFLR